MHNNSTHLPAPSLLPTALEISPKKQDLKVKQKQNKLKLS